MFLKKAGDKQPGIFAVIRCLITIHAITFVLLISSSSSIAIAQNINLNYYISTAVTNSPLLSDYHGQVLANKIDSQRIRASYLPQVTGISNNHYSPVIGGIGYDHIISNSILVSALVVVNKTIVSKKYLGMLFETLRIHNQGLENNAKISEQDIRRTVTAQYIIAYGSMQQFNFIREVYILLKKEEKILKRMT